MIIIDLIYNLSVLVALSVLSGFIDSRYDRNTLLGKILQGILFGGVAIIGMLNPFSLTGGIIFDGRSIVISICTLFFGPISGLISSISAVIFRNYLGGGGVLMGSLVVAESFLVGYLFHLYKVKRKFNTTRWDLYSFGFFVSAVMMGLMLTLPTAIIKEAYEKITITVMIFYPLITMLIGKVLLDQEENRNYLDRINQEKKLYLTTLYSIGDGVITTDLNGNVKRMNYIAEKITGWNEAEAIGKPVEEIFKIVSEGTKNKVESPVHKVLKEGVVAGLANHTLLISKNGEEIPISDSGAPIRSEKGKIEGMVLVFRDKTEEHKAEKLVSQSEARLRRAELASKAGNWELHLDSKIMIASEGAAKLYGVDKNEFDYETVKIIPLPEYRPMMDSALRNLIEKKEPYDIEFKIKTADRGEIKDIHSVAHYDKEKRILFGVIQDITERKKAENALKERETFLNNLLATMPIPVYYKDKNGNYIDANNSFTSLFGYSKEQLIGKGIFDLYPSELATVYSVKDKELFENPGLQVYESQFMDANGDIRDVIFHKAAFRNDNGEIVGLIGAVLDVTEPKRAEENLRESNEKYTSLFSSMNEGVVLHEVLYDEKGKAIDYRIIEMNPSFERHTGIKYETAINKLGSELYGTSPAPYLDVYSKVAATREPAHFDTYFPPLEKYFDISVFSPRKGMFATIFTDITESKLAAEKIEQSEKRFRSIVENTDAGYFFIDKEGIIKDVNEAWIKLYKYDSRDEIVGQHFTVIQRIDESESAKVFVEGIMNGNQDFMKGGFSRKCKDGSFGYHSFYAKPVNYLGDVIGIEGFIIDITERKRAEEALKKAEALYRDLVETAQDLIWQCDAEGRYTFLNHAWKEVLGYEIEELLGKKFSDFQTKEWAEKDLKEFDGLLRGNIISGLETVHIAKDGREINLIFNAKFIHDDAGNIIGTRGTAFNITERKRAEEALRKSEEKFKQLVWDMQVGVLLQGPQAEILLSNPKSLELLGLTEDQILGKTSFDSSWNVIHEDGSPFPGSTHPVPQAIATRQSVRNVIMGVYRPTTKNRVWLLVDAEPRLNEDGTVKHVICTFINITERKRAEEALRQSEEKNRTTLYSIGDGVITTNNFGFINQMNPIAEILTGWRESEAKDKPLEEVFKIINEKTRNSVENPVNIVLKEGKIVGLANHTLLISKDGNEIPIADSGAPIRNEDGDINGVVLVFRDQLKERAAQKILEESEEQLKQSQRVARIGYYIFDIKKDSWTSSEMLDELFGIDKNYKRTAEGWLNLVHPEQREEMALYLTNHILNEKKEFNKEYKIQRTNDNAVFWVHGLGTLEFDEKGNPVKMFGTIQDVTERKESQNLIETSLKEKEILLKEIHHRVKNNFQRIISLIALQTELIEDQKILNIFEDLQNRLRTMSLIHELMYGKGEFVGVDINDYIGRLTNYLVKTYSSGNIKLNLDLENHVLDLDTIIPCGLITNEIITNSLKYAFPDDAEGSINISFKKMNDEFCLTFLDDGIGIKNKIDFENINSLGLRLVDLLTKQIRGTLEVVQPDNGVQFIIKFKGEN